MKMLVINPNGWPCTFIECPPGLFVVNNDLCLKTEYGNDEAYCDSGEAFARKDAIVQPVVAEWIEVEE
jgi:hypothetical protein